MKHGIVENNKFVLIDDDLRRLKNTLAFMPAYSESDIKEYDDAEVEKGYDGAFYLKGFAPARPAEEKAAEVRAERDKRLAATDYLLMPDYPIDAERLEAVKAYRQALRDITAQEGFPDNVQWPEMPEDEPEEVTPDETAEKADNAV